MLAVAFAIGLYSYGILVIGLLGLLTPIPVLVVTIPFAFFIVLKIKKALTSSQLSFSNFSRLEQMTVFLIVGLLLVGFIGALGPEIGFDALWYHLTIPKIFIQREAINFIEGNLFYYSLLPKLTEMLYVPSLMLGGENLTKLTHYMFSIMTSVVLYQIIRLFLKRRWALLGVLAFNSNLVIAWLMTSSYIDLSRAFYETIALFYILKFALEKKKRFLYLSALLLGFAISAKIVSLTSIPVFIAVILFSIKGIGKILKYAFQFTSLSLLVPLPWFLIAIYYRDNPFYPLFSRSAPEGLNFSSLNPIAMIQNISSTFLLSPDPINPIYFILLPIIFIIPWKKLRTIKPVVIYSTLTLVLWYLATYLGFWHATDQAGGARFLTSYLPGYTLLSVFLIKNLKSKKAQNILIAGIVFIALASLFYRVIASFKYIPVVVGLESKQDFLMKRLNFSFGDFYDENDEIKKIVGDDLVLLYGMHNLYYVDFKFTLDEWENSEKAKFVLVQQGELDSDNAELIYENKKTNVKLYKL